MSPRRKKSPENVSAEAIFWHDAQIQFRKKLDTSPTLNLTIGFVVYDGKDMVVLAHELTTGDDWMDDDMDYTKIPLSMIIRREKLGVITVYSDGEKEVVDDPKDRI